MTNIPSPPPTLLTPKIGTVAECLPLAGDGQNPDEGDCVGQLHGQDWKERW